MKQGLEIKKHIRKNVRYYCTYMYMVPTTYIRIEIYTTWKECKWKKEELLKTLFFTFLEAGASRLIVKPPTSADRSPGICTGWQIWQEHSSPVWYCWYDLILGIFLSWISHANMHQSFTPPSLALDSKVTTPGNKTTSELTDRTGGWTAC